MKNNNIKSFIKVSFPPWDCMYALLNAYLCHVTNFHCVYRNTVLFHCVVFLSTLYPFIPSLTFIKSLHPQTDQREGWSFSLLIPSLQFDADFE